MDTSSADKEQVMRNLSELTQGLYFMSESDYPLEPFTVTAVKEDELSPDELRGFAGKPADANVEVVELTYFLRNMTKVPPEADPARIETTLRFQALQDFMVKSLSDVKVYRVGKVEVTALALGSTSSGEFAGFRTVLIET
ncbi:nuclease A inhibitor family protein [Rufibacter glacialis]|nr:nuclease A inhibitor family protein [Rufibacter glacialis]